MKKEFVRASMTPDQLKTMHQQLAKLGTSFPYSGLLLLIADVVDEAVKGSNSYMTIGVTRDKSAIICTVSVDAHKLYASGATLAEVADKATGLL